MSSTLCLKASISVSLIHHSQSCPAPDKIDCQQLKLKREKKSSEVIKISLKMDQKYIDIARNELREDDLRKSQSLVQFRDWLSKHPFLSEVRQGKMRFD